MGDREALAMIEAAYAFDRTDEEWVRGVLETARPFDLGGGIGAYIAALGSPQSVRAMSHEGALRMPSLHLGAKLAPPALWALLHAPRPTTNLGEVMGPAVMQGLVPAEFASFMESVPNSWGVIGGDAAHETFVLAIACNGRQLTPGDRAALDCVGAHLGAALRLRSVQKRAPVESDASVEAVVSTDGKLLDLRGSEAEASSRTLTDAVQKTERARSRKATSEERLATWTALVEGRWSIVETTESDGKRMLLAVKNEPRTANMRKLTSRERSAVSYAALGHSYKYIAYELGIKAPTVSALVKTALQKLGLASRADLIRLFG
jgi:DNA-binding CsgD family transcriptional regulator